MALTWLPQSQWERSLPPVSHPMSARLALAIACSTRDGAGHRLLGLRITSRPCLGPRGVLVGQEEEEEEEEGRVVLVLVLGGSVPLATLMTVLIV